jgi:hypothetical protein
MIRAHQHGSDVLAVKRAMKKMRVPGVGKLDLKGYDGLTAGSAFVSCVNTVLNAHGHVADGIYGKIAHSIIAPYFDAYGVALYKAARIRKLPNPAPPHLTAQKAAQSLLEHYAKGRYRSDNPGDLRDIQATAAGRAVWSPAMKVFVRVDPRPLEAVLWLIEAHKLRIGTYAITSDHFGYDNHGHSRGYAIDISSINGIGINSHASRQLTYDVMRLLHNGPGDLKPWQLICDGCGYGYDAEIAGLIVPYRNFYDHSTLIQHRNHIHLGYY